MFVVFEGIDGSGTTAISNLAKEQLGENVNVKWTALPSLGNDLGESIRNRLRSTKLFCTEHSLAHLFIADHLEHAVREVIPYVGTSEHVFCDRWVFSTYAYQRSTIPWYILDSLVLPHVYFPDLTFYLEIDPEVAEKRVQARSSERERYDKLELQREIASNYHDAFQHFFDPAIINDRATNCVGVDRARPKLVVLDASKPIESVLEEVVQHIRNLLP